MPATVQHLLIFKYGRIMRYFVRALKYFAWLCVLYIAIVWIMYWSGSLPERPWQMMGIVLSSERGILMMAAFVVLAAAYPMFGFMRKRIAGDMVRNREQIVNAFRMQGFRLTEERDGEMVFRGEGFVKRLSLLYEDRIVVRGVGDGLELNGIRRSVARIAYRLDGYIFNSRFDDK